MLKTPPPFRTQACSQSGCWTGCWTGCWNWTARLERGIVRIKLSDERRADLIQAIRGYFREHLDEDIGELKASLLLDFLVKKLGPPVYNRAIRDAHAFIQEKLLDLEGEFYEPESGE